MSILSKFTHCALAAFLTFGLLSPASQVVAQTSSPTDSVCCPQAAALRFLIHQTR